MSKRKKAQLLELFAERVRPGQRHRVWLTHDDPCLSWLRFPDKVFAEEEILSLSAADLRFFIDRIHRWDGDFTRRCAYLQHEKRLDAVSLVQAAAVLSSRSTKWYEANGGRHCAVNVHRLAERWASRVLITRPTYTGVLHSLDVPSGMLIVRRNAAVVVCASGEHRARGGGSLAALA